MKIRFVAVLSLVLLALGLVQPAMAVSTSHWIAAGESDFKGGKLHNVVVTNLGDIKLSRAIQTIQDQDADVTTVNALAQTPDGTIYAGTGPKAKLLAVKEGRISTAATFGDAVNVLSVIGDDAGGLILGTGGDKGKVLRIKKAGDKPEEIFSDEDVQYVWSLARTPDGNIYAATGPNGQVFEIKPDGSHSEIYRGSEDNITALASDGKDLLYFGTDPNGLIVRFNRKTKDVFILYNTAEREITALALDHAGNLYAATGEVSDRQHTPKASDHDKIRGGRPESEPNGSPIPSNPAPAPSKPPELPNPNPGEPKPIPKKHSMRLDDSRAINTSQPLMMMVADGSSENADDSSDDSAAPGGPPSAPNPPGGAPAPDIISGGAAHHPPIPAMEQSATGDQRPDGNAIYKIDTDGFVTEIFRQNAVIYSMIVQNDLLLVGTGGEGNIYQVNPAAEETEVLAKVDAKQVMCLLPVKDGRIVMGLANSGGISALSSGYASDGTYISAVLDATQASRFGKMQLHGQLPDGTTLKVSTRSGNVKDSDAPGWSKWTADESAQEYVKVTAPSARFMQYRLTFATTDPARTPLVDRVDVPYQIPNLAPVIKSIKIGSGDDGENANGGAAGAGHNGETAGKPANTTVTIAWEASDANNDNLSYSLYFRFEPRGQWILLKDNVKETSYEWNTRTAADGRYQVKVVASDALSNPPGQGKTSSRVSSYFVIDNTAPTIGDLVIKATGSDVKIDLQAQDQTSIIANVEYTVDSSDDWQSVLPVDNIYDSPDEKVSFAIKGLAAGSHQVTIRATDSHGNAALQTAVVKIEGPTARGQ
ncbi:MAG: hypothetical protein M3O30_19125 [Planctomycetota bacterium]|nr:hypothetical protein [Planctomycetota bacterium]